MKAIMVDSRRQRLYIHTGESKLHGMENKWVVLVNDMKQRNKELKLAILSF